jgi:fumarate hydratase class II
MNGRYEQDTMGRIKVPHDAYYGAQTQRAVENFKISGLRFPRPFIQALGLIKKHAALANRRLGRLEAERARAISAAAQEVLDGRHDEQFVVDVFQTGSGTSTNMNANEVIAGRANEILTGKRGGRSPIHPNDHVNLGQSSNDVIPSAIHVSAVQGLHRHLHPAMDGLWKELKKKVRAFRTVRKIARTHLQDAVPMSLGEEFSGYARQVELGMKRIRGVQANLSELALGGTAVGNGVNSHPRFASMAIAGISKETGLSFREARNHFEAQAAQDAAVEASGALRVVAVSLIKIANDIRWLSSGPRCGLGEIRIPSLQPGSSIMPGKINPVVPEAVLQVAAQVIGNDATVAHASQAGNFELLVMFPVIAYNLLQSIDLLTNAALALGERCVEGIEADRNKCRANLEESLAVATALVPEIGYDRAAALAKEAFETGKTVREVALSHRVLQEADVHEALDAMIKGRRARRKKR